MRLLVLSDVHLEVEPFDPPPVQADLVVLAGDIANGTDGVEWAERSFRVPVIYVAGNHEYYERDFGAVRGALKGAANDRVRLLDCSEAISDDLRFLGCTLWTDYTLAPEAARAAVVEEARSKNPDYEKVRLGGRKFAPEDAIA